MSEADVAPVLAVRNLGIVLVANGRKSRLVDQVDITIDPGEIVALLGESGCGKSLTALAVLGLLPGACRAEGHILFEGQDLLGAGRHHWRHLRGRRMSMIFQDPGASLNPMLTVGRQISETLRRHAPAPRARINARVVELLRDVGVTDPERRVGAYPHEFSGGMCQRVMIAMAICCEPALLIADEPTTALDVTVQKQILALVRRLSREHGTGVLLISHDLGAVAEIADRVAVMYAGRVVEEAPAASLFAAASHPYTQGLLRAMPVLGAKIGRLAAIEGSVPAPGEMPEGCRFAPRCPLADERCRQVDPGLRPIAPGRRVRCWYPAVAP